MKATDHSIAVTRTARYFTLGEMNEHTKRVWFVLHGYGQLAEYFIRKFETIQNHGTLIVAPEALSRFYQDHESGRVGASWMTREDRLSEIDDYVAYLESVQREIFKDFSSQNIHITILGFSQGTATACRWVNQSELKCDRLILWGGYFANGILELVEEERLPRILEYKGDHAINAEVLVERFGYNPLTVNPLPSILPINRRSCRLRRRQNGHVRDHHVGRGIHGVSDAIGDVLGP